MLQAIQNNSCNYIENYTTKKDIGFGLLHKTAESSFAAPQALSKISDAAKQRACVYRPAFRSASTEKVGFLTIMRLWPEAVANVVTGNTTYDKGFGAFTVLSKNSGGGMPIAEPHSGCEPCSGRTYQDDSGDAGFSFQAPTGLPSSTAALFVVSHEGEHATRETARAQEKGDIVTNKTVTLQMGVCPECHKMYVKGGTTSITKISGKNSEKSVVEKAADLLGSSGGNIDIAL